MSESAALSPPSRRSSDTGPGRNQNWLGSAWSANTVMPSTMIVFDPRTNMGFSISLTRNGAMNVERCTRRLCAFGRAVLSFLLFCAFRTACEKRRTSMTGSTLLPQAKCSFTGITGDAPPALAERHHQRVAGGGLPIGRARHAAERDIRDLVLVAPLGVVD